MTRFRPGFVFLLLLWSTGSAQRSPDRELLLQKSRQQNKGAWICLATGAALLITAVAIPRGELEGYSPNTLYTDREYRNDEIKSLTGLAGLACAGGSIPLFIASARNRRQALGLSLQLPTGPGTLPAKGPHRNRAIAVYIRF